MMTMVLQAIQNNEYAGKVIYVIKNGNPDSRNSRNTWKKVKGKLEQQGTTYKLYETQYPGHAKEIAAQILSRTSTNKTVIAVIGGDGTIHEAVNGALPFPNAVIVSIPAGSGNDFARGVQKSVKWENSVGLLAEEKIEKKIDVGMLECEGENRNFVNSIGIGFDASICVGVNRSKWKRHFHAIKMGKFIYLYYVLKQLFLFKRFTLQVEMDGKQREFKNVWFLVAANQPYFGGGMKIAPDAKSTDHKLHVIIVKDVSAFQFLLVFATVLWGGHTGLRWVETFTCEKIAVESDIAAPIQADGEIVGQTSFKAKVLPEALNIRSM